MSSTAPERLAGAVAPLGSPVERPRDGLLAALAEAPDYVAAASFLLTQVAATTGAPRLCLYRFEPGDEALVLVTRLGFDESATGSR